jgi:hypothetical protein
VSSTRLDRRLSGGAARGEGTRLLEPLALRQVRLAFFFARGRPTPRFW